MKVRRSGYRVVLLLGLGAVLFFLVFFDVDGQAKSISNGNVFALEGPPFVRTTSAEALDVISDLDAEAGMSAWFQSPDAINLSQVRGQFRTIEDETVDYIIGSVPVSGYTESADPHVYVHRDGWILAYYRSSDTIGKIIDTLGKTITTTKLKNVVAAVAGAAGAPFADAMYYDFRYPNATHMMLIAEDEYNGRSFTILLPSTYGYFERGWAAMDESHYYPGFMVDGVELPEAGRDASCNGYGGITAAQLEPDVTHTAELGVIWTDWGAIAILYRVP